MTSWLHGRAPVGRARWLDPMARTPCVRPVASVPGRTVFVFGLVASMMVAHAPPASGAANSCRARDVTQGTAHRSNLQAVIDAASRGDTINIRNVCVGHFRIDKGLKLKGVSNPVVPQPILHADSPGTVLRIAAPDQGCGCSEDDVTLTNLAITGGDAAGLGGGINNDGATVTLVRSNVRGNHSDRGGGGIYNAGTLSVQNSAGQQGRASSITGNTTGGLGGGIYNDGSLVLLGASVAGNVSAGYGGGIANFNFTSFYDA